MSIWAEIALRAPFYLTISLLSLMSVGRAAAETRLPKIEYTYPDQSVWTTRRDPQGRLLNPLLTFAARMFSEAGIEWYGSPLPAARMFALLQGDTPAFSILVKAPALSECCIWGKTPVAHTELRAFYPSSGSRIGRPQDLAGQRVATIRGYSYGGLKALLADPGYHITVSPAGDHDAAFGMLARGHADYVLDYTGPAQEVLERTPIEGIRSDVVGDLDVFLVLSKRYPDAEAVMARLDAIAARLIGPAP